MILRSLLAFLLVSAASAIAASPTEFADIRWEASVLEVRQTMLRRPGVVLSEERPDRLTFTGGTFANTGAETWQFDFTHGKFTRGTVRLARSSGKDAKGWINDQIFNSIRDALDKKYAKSIKVSDGGHAEQVWEFRDASGPAKSIRFYYGFGDNRRFDITYSYDRSPPPATPKPNPGKLKRDGL